MKVETLFNVGDTAYVLQDLNCYRVTVNEIDVEVDSKGEIKTIYIVNKYIPKGIFNEYEEEEEIEESELFLSKQDVKNKLKEIEEHKIKGEELDKYKSKNRYVSELLRYTYTSGWDKDSSEKFDCYASKNTLNK